MLDLRKEQTAICKALRSAAAKARANGIKNPQFFVEPEGPAIFVMDGDHPGQINSGHVSIPERQAAIVGEISVLNIGAILDVGAW